MGKFRKLTTHDLAFGIGRVATDEELEELLSRKETGKGLESAEAILEIKRRLAAQEIKKAS